MHCNRCGAENPEGSGFCSACGMKMSGKRFCNRCGAENPAENDFCSSCGAQIGVTSSAMRSSPAIQRGAQAAQSRSEAVNGHLIGTGVGAIMMLVAIPFTWYTYHVEAEWGASGSAPVTFGDLLDAQGLNWAGNPMPLILMIVFAAVILLLAGYFWLAGAATKERMKPLSWLGSLAALCLIANVGYLNYESLSQEPETYTAFFVPHAGWGVAFVGVVVAWISSRLARGRLQ